MALRRMKPTRRAECAELMVSANNVSVVLARTLLTERCIRRKSFDSVRRLNRQIEWLVQRYNADASPFKWVATADSSFQKIERLAKRVSATGR